MRRNAADRWHQAAKIGPLRFPIEPERTNYSNEPPKSVKASGVKTTHAIWRQSIIIIIYWKKASNKRTCITVQTVDELRLCVYLSKPVKLVTNETVLVNRHSQTSDYQLSRGGRYRLSLALSASAVSPKAWRRCEQTFLFQGRSQPASVDLRCGGTLVDRPTSISPWSNSRRHLKISTTLRIFVHADSA